MNFVLFSTVFFLAVCIGKIHKFTSLAFFVAISNAISCLVLLAVLMFDLSKYNFVVNGSYFTAMPMDGLHEVGTKAIFIFVIINALVLFSVILASLFNVSRKSDFVEYNFAGFNNSYEILSMWAAVLLTGILLAYYFTKVNFDVFMYNSDYLLLKTPSMVGLYSSFDRILHFILRPIGVGVAIIAAYSMSKRYHFLQISSLILFLVFVSWALVSNSRWGSMYIMVFAFVAWASGVRLLTLLLAVFSALYAFIFVIVGRSQQEYGLLVVPDVINSIDADVIFRSLMGAVVNVFDGALNLANSLLIEPSTTLRYQILSLSPLPSSIDGFRDVLLTDEERISRVVPFGSYSEVARFPAFLVCIYSILIMMSISIITFSERIMGKMSPYLTLICLYPFLLVPSYPVRNSFRMIILAVALSICVIILRDFVRSRLMSER